MRAWGLVRKLCCVPSKLCKGRAFCSWSSTAPLLMIPTRNLFTPHWNGRLSNTSYPYCFFSLADMPDKKEKNTTKVLLPNQILPWDKELLFPDDLRYIGSSHGWVACLNPRTMTAFLFNPLSPSDSITLLPTLPLPTGQFSHWKLIMSAPPSDPSCRVLATGGGGTICFWKPGDTSWTPLPREYDRCAGLEALYSNHRRCFYVFHFLDGAAGVVHAWDLSGSPAMTTSARIGSVMPPADYYDEYYLAESPSSGDLFFVYREIQLWEGPKRLLHNFHVCKLDLERPEENREHDCRSSFLDQDALFLGKNDSFWLPRCDDFPVEPDSIYFTENDYSSYPEAFDSHRRRGFDMLIDTPDAITPYSYNYFRNTKKKKSTDPIPIWVMCPPSSTASFNLVERYVGTTH